MTDWPDVRKYDDVDAHIDAAVEAGQPEEHAFSHIGLYLGWLIRRDLVDPEWFVDEHIAAVKAGGMNGSDLVDSVDGKLVSDMLTPGGTAFTDWYYERYLEDFGAAFSNEPQYGVSDGDAASAILEPVLDTRYQEWIQAERPKRVPSHFDSTNMPDLRNATIAVPDLDAMDLAPDVRALLEQFHADARERGWQVIQAPTPPPPHEAPELEALFPPDLGDPPVEISSRSARDWRSSVLNRVLKDLGVSPREAMVAIAMAGRGERNVTAGITSIPGIDRARLSEIVPRLEKPPGGKAEVRSIGAKVVTWWTTGEFIKVAWAADGMVMMVAGSDTGQIESAIAKLP